MNGLPTGNVTGRSELLKCNNCCMGMRNARVVTDRVGLGMKVVFLLGIHESRFAVHVNQLATSTVERLRLGGAGHQVFYRHNSK